MRRFIRHTIEAILVSMMFATAAEAQFRSIGGFGSGSMGGSSLGSMGGGIGSFGGSGFGSSAFGSSSLGNRGFGSSSFGSSGLGGVGSFGSSSSMSMGAGGGFGSTGTMGSGQAGQNFVGRSSSDFTSAMNQLNRGGQQFLQRFGQIMNRGGQGNRGASQQENALPPVQVRLDVAFDYAPATPSVVASSVNARLDKAFAHRNIARPEVTMVGDTVVLRGVAASESQRLVIERLVAMEPGVAAVENQMTVVPAPTEETLPAKDN